MKLSLFNKWRKLGHMAGKVLEYKTSKNGRIFVTEIREKTSGQIITKGHGKIKAAAQKNAVSNLRRIGAEGFFKSLETRQPVMPLINARIDREEQERKAHIDWQGTTGNHRIVSDGMETLNFDSDLADIMRELENEVQRHY